MQSLENLTREASALALNEVPITFAKPMSVAEGEVSRIMQICNACRYCEGFCAVFPAMTRRLEFGRADVHFLSNLCHNCGACLHACQYAPPHEFGVNVPKAMAEVRLQTYVDYAWPAGFGALYKRNGLTLALALAGGLALFLIMTMALKGSLLLPPLAGNFYAVFPHNTLALLFGIVFVFAMIALGVGVRKFWRNEDPGAMSAEAIGEATHDVLSLRYLGGGHGEGCNNADDAFSLARRRFHHLTFYGFMLCFASTCVATLYHYLLKLEAPYAISSVPVVLGSLGGLGLLAGPSRFVVAEPEASSAARRRRAKADGPRFYRVAVVDQRERSRTVDSPRYVHDGVIAGRPPWHCDGAVPDAAVREIRARDLSQCSTFEMGRGKTPTE